MVDRRSYMTQNDRTYDIRILTRVQGLLGLTKDAKVNFGGIDRTVF